MINTLENPVFCKLVEKNNIGINVEPENVKQLAEVIEKYMVNNDKQGKNARILAKTQFDRKVTYQSIVEIINDI